MAYTLNDALIALARFCLPKHSGISTGGSTTTLLDSVRKVADDQFNYGIIFILTGTYAGQYGTVTDYVNSTGQFTFSPALAGNVTSGVLYEAYKMVSGMNMYDAIGAINQALDTVGDVLQEDTTLTTVDGQESYDLPSGVYNLQMVEIARSPSLPYRWMPSLHWSEINDDLRFESQNAHFGNAYPIRLTYLAKHATLDTYEDAINAQINTEWLKYQAAINLITSMANRGMSWSTMKTQYEKAESMVEQLRPKRGSLRVSVRAA